VVHGLIVGRDGQRRRGDRLATVERPLAAGESSVAAEDCRDGMCPRRQAGGANAGAATGEWNRRAYAPLFQGLRTTFPCVFEGFSRELRSYYIITINYNALYSPIHYRKVASM
jgi:hypothetical protein